MNIEDFDNDTFLAEARRRVDAGYYSPDNYMSQHQSDDRAKYRILASRCVELKVEAIQRGLVEIEALIELTLLADQLDAIRGNPIVQHTGNAVNTYYAGKETYDQNHQPEGM